jgi:hypothetical protein
MAKRISEAERQREAVDKALKQWALSTTKPTRRVSGDDGAEVSTI